MVFHWMMKLLRPTQETSAADDPAPDETCEPWNNAYQLSADTLELLRDLRHNPMDEEELVRHFISGHDVERLLEDGQCRNGAEQKIADLRDFVASSGTATSFGAAIEEWEARLAEFRKSVRWQDVPEELRELCRRRAECVLTHARRKGWVQCGDGLSCSITPAGRQVLAREASAV